jgi:hypothetical protein
MRLMGSDRHRSTGGLAIGVLKELLEVNIWSFGNT